MPIVEFEGRDLEEAIAKAASNLNLPPENMKFSVLTMGSKGFFGLGRRKAKIAVDPDDATLTIIDEPAPAKPSGRNKPARDVPGAKPRGDFKAEAPRPEPQTGGETHLPKKGGQPQEQGPTPAAEPGHTRPPRVEKGRGSSTEPQLNQPGGTPPQPLDWTHVPPPLTRPSPEESISENPQGPTAELAVLVVKEITDQMGLKTDLMVSRIGPRIIISLNGPDNALLIGSRGSTLESLQLLTTRIVSKRLKQAEADNEIDPRIVVDVADYRHHRQEQVLTALKTVAEQVRQTHKSQVMPGLNYAERRLVQTALRPFKDLTVQPIGGRNALVIAPTEAPRTKRPRHHRGKGQTLPTKE